MLSKAEVGDGDLVAPLVQDDVAEFEIPMNNVCFMQVTHNLNHSVENDECLLLIEFLLPDDVML